MKKIIGPKTDRISYSGGTVNHVKVLARFLFIIIFIFFFFMIGPQLLEEIRDRQALPGEVPRQPPLTILRKSPQFSLLKEFRGIYLSRNVKLEEKTAYMAVSFDEIDPVHLASFDMSTGETNWRVNGVGKVTVGESYVYFPSRKDYGSVVAYDKETGDQVWERVVDSLYVIADLRITTFGLFVTTASHGATRFHLLDEKTGKKRQTFQTYEEWQVFLIKNGLTVHTVEDHQMDHQIVMARGRNNWQTHINFESGPFTSPVQLIESGDQIVVYGEGKTQDKLVVLNREDGTILWQTLQGAKSNLAIDQGVLFFVTEESDLVAFDMQAGHKIGSVSFSPVADKGSGYYNDVTIAADGRKLFVYFASSGQIFYFVFQPN